jgi:hypothetical protein
MEDTTEDALCTHEALGLDRIKDKIRAIWDRIIVAEYNEKYANQKEDSEDYVSLDDYIKDKHLYFPDDPRPASEVDGILELLDGMFNDKEDLDPIDSSGSSPSYAGKSLKSVSEGRSSNPGTYKYTHSTTTTPSDSPTTVSSTSYTIPKSGSLKRNKSSDRSTAISRSLMELLEEERRKLLKIVTRRNKEFGVIL